MRYARRTTVAPEKTRLEIEQAVHRYGADQFAFAQAPERAMVQFRLTKPHPLIVRFNLPLSFQGDCGQTVPLTDQQRIRQRWRALLLSIKAKLEAVECGIETIEHAFLGEIVLPDGRTMAEWAEPQLQAMIEQNRMPAALLEFAQ